MGHPDMPQRARLLRRFPNGKPVLTPDFGFGLLLSIYAMPPGWGWYQCWVKTAAGHMPYVACELVAL